jgi:hypothetical protein
MRSLRTIAVLVLATAACSSHSFAALANAFLSVDFQPATGITETGFQPFIADGTSPLTTTYSTTEGNLSVTLSQYTNPGNTGNGFPPDSGAFTYGQLYQDNVFLLNDSSPMKFTLSGPAIAPNVRYQITWYSYYYNQDVPDSAVYSPGAGSNTTGSTGTIVETPGGATPLTNADSSFTGIWSSTDNSLEIDVRALNAVSPQRVYVNGFEIVALPEPSVGLCALGGVTLLFRRYRRAI